MSRPAARIGDMHVCPMVTPGLPPIPHVGGPIVGPGVPTVLIGNMPAAVMGDMCTCVGPPDSLILGSTGVLIGGKPAVRMGDMTAHGGTITIGCPTVLIGEISPGTVMTKQSLTVLEQLLPKASSIAQQVLSMQQAAGEGKPFCEICEGENQENQLENKKNDHKKEENKEEEKEIIGCYFTDENDVNKEIETVSEGKYVNLVIETSNMIGEQVELNIKSDDNLEYNGIELTEDILKIGIEKDKQSIKLKVIEN